MPGNVHWPHPHCGRHQKKGNYNPASCGTLSTLEPAGLWLLIMRGEYTVRKSPKEGHFSKAEKLNQATLLMFSHWVVSDTFAIPWTVTQQVPPSMGFSRQVYLSGLPFPSSGNLSDPGIKPVSPALAGGFFTTEPLGKPNVSYYIHKNTNRNLGKMTWQRNIFQKQEQDKTPEGHLNKTEIGNLKKNSG